MLVNSIKFPMYNEKAQILLDNSVFGVHSVPTFKILCIN